MYKKFFLLFFVLAGGIAHASQDGLRPRRLHPSPRARAMEARVLSTREFEQLEDAFQKAICDLAAESAERGRKFIKQFKRNENAIDNAASCVGCCIGVCCAATTCGAIIYLNELKKQQ